ncbi:MAG TPA: PKD domain-containing protein, partial [Candidatus Bathyarchaeia archaeon]|nr:PKD domain-containing protein [Candidatus Bathyarchaeia archaeon]
TFDSLPSDAVSDSHVYAAAGTFTVYVNATDDAGLTTQSSNLLLPITDRPPVAVLNTSTTLSQTLSNIGFNATGSFDPDGTIVGYAWNFGDGTSGSGFAVTHSYSEEGNYTVVLAVTDNSGSVGWVSILLTIQDRAPTASFTFTPTSPLAGQVLGFDGSSSYDSDGTVIGFVWNFGDGTTSNGINASHTYATNGTYTVSLTVMDDDGITGNSGASIIVGYDPAPTWGSGSSIRAARVDAHDVALVWNGALDQVQVSSFTLYLNGTFLTNVPGSTSGYTVAGLTPLSHYVFQVQAGNPSGNHSVDGPSTTVFTKLSGDVNLDCQVDIVDLAMVGSAFGSSLGQPRY